MASIGTKRSLEFHDTTLAQRRKLNSLEEEHEISREIPHHLIHDREIEILKEHIAEGSQINLALPGSQLTLLHYAADEGNLEIVRLLVERGAYLNAQTNKWVTPLHVAVAHGFVDIVEYLLEQGADYRLACKDYIDIGNTPIETAVEKGNIETVKLLTKKYIEDERHRELPIAMARDRGLDELADFMDIAATTKQREIDEKRSAANEKLRIENDRCRARYYLHD